MLSVDTEFLNRHESFLLEVKARDKIPGMVLGIQHKTETLMKAWGHGDLENDIPMTRNSVHNIGSVSKIITAVAAMQLVEQGKLELDQDIRYYLPWFPKKEHPITTRHLMTHTSGIRHYIDGEYGEDDVLSRQHFTDYAASTKRWRDDPLLFTPGTHWYYSSYGSGLLHGIIEVISGVSFENYLRQHVWQPASMTVTQFDNPYHIIKHRSKGYANAPDSTLVHAPFADLSNRYASGGMVSSAEDMLSFGQALQGKTLLKTQTIKEMFAPQVDASLPDWDKTEARSWKPALMWELYDTPLGSALGHQGSVRGTNQFFIVFPEHQLTIYLHTNHDDVDSTAIVMRVIELLKNFISRSGGML